MRKRRLDAGGCLFIVGVVALTLFFGIFRFVTGRLPTHFDYIVWGFIALSIFVEAYLEVLKAIDESTSDTKEEITRLEERIEEKLRKLEQK